MEKDALPAPCSLLSQVLNVLRRVKQKESLGSNLTETDSLCVVRVLDVVCASAYVLCDAHVSEIKGMPDWRRIQFTGACLVLQRVCAYKEQSMGACCCTAAALPTGVECIF